MDQALARTVSLGHLLCREVRVFLPDDTMVRTTVWGFDEHVVLLGKTRSSAIPLAWHEFVRIEEIA